MENESKLEIRRINQYNKIKETLFNNGVILLTTENEYKNTGQQIYMQCKCGNIFHSMAGGYKSTRQCLDCRIKLSHSKSITSNEEINDALALLSKRDNRCYSWVDGKHENRRSKLTIQDEFGYKYTQYTYRLVNGKGTFVRFHSNNPFTIHNIQIWLNEFASGYKILSTEYINTFEKLLFECPDGHQFKCSWDKIQVGQRCTVCQLSIGAREVLYSLRKLGVKYELEYIFNDCIYKHVLPFDFAILNDDNSVKCLIEFDGEFHYKEPPFSNCTDKNLRSFKFTKIRDEVKNKYCIENNIPLLRIPYWERDNGNIESIVYKFLSNLDNKVA